MLIIFKYYYSYQWHQLVHVVSIHLEGLTPFHKVQQKLKQDNLNVKSCHIIVISYFNTKYKWSCKLNYIHRTKTKTWLPWKRNRFLKNKTLGRSHFLMFCDSWSKFKMPNLKEDENTSVVLRIVRMKSNIVHVLDRDDPSFKTSGV